MVVSSAQIENRGAHSALYTLKSIQIKWPMKIQNKQPSKIRRQIQKKRRNACNIGVNSPVNNNRFIIEQPGKYSTSFLQEQIFCLPEFPKTFLKMNCPLFPLSFSFHRNWLSKREMLTTPTCSKSVRFSFHLRQN